MDSAELKKIETLIEGSIEEIKNKKGNFCISTSIPNEWLIKEEQEWDKNLGYKTIKSKINAKIIEKIKEKTGKEYDPADANFRISYNLKNEEFQINNEPVFIFGRYEKYSREISQTRWVCRHCNGKGCKECNEQGRNYLSIEEIIGEEFKKEFQCKNYYLHASGREDVDVENHAGRLFVLQIIDPENIEVDLRKIEQELDSNNKNKRVKIRNLRIVRRGFVEMVSNSHFNKSYTAEVELGRKVLKKDLKMIKEMQGVVLKQKTPERVKHRRKDTIRERRIININVKQLENKTIEIELTTEPGTYIKELINGDNGRTKPNISEILKTNAKCIKLTVNKIYDEFLDSIG